MTAATISRWKAYLGSTGSPVTYTAIEEVFNIAGLGQTNDLLDVTNFDSPTGTKEYIGGNADGQEVTIEANYIHNATQQLAMVSAVVAKTNRQFRVSYVGVSPAKTYTFTCTPLSYDIVPSVDNKNVIRFVVKISGALS
jgi:hypothetical protein